jgi:multisubunit Na+/H+ antiporter MnhC subunit
VIQHMVITALVVALAVIEALLMLRPRNGQHA